MFRVNLLLPYSGWMSECLKLIKDKGCLELALGHVKKFEICLQLCADVHNLLHIIIFTSTRCDQQALRLIFLLGGGYTSGHPYLQGGVLELPLSLGQGKVPACLSVLCELRSKRVVYLHLVIVRAMRDVRRARAARVHQVLCETGTKWCGEI